MVKRGEIVLLSYPFTNLKTSKVRPALVISSDSFNKKQRDAIFLFITTKIYNSPYDLRITKTNPDFRATGLKEPSTFRMSKLICLDQRLIRKRIGQANKSILSKVEQAIKSLLKLS